MRASALVLLICLACGGSQSPLRGPVVPDEEPTSGSDTPPEATDGVSSLPRIGDEQAWRSLAYRPEYQASGRTEVTKVLIDLEEQWRIYFLQSERWTLHYSFVRANIDPRADHATFNIREYQRPDRRFICASIVRYLDANLWTVELSAADNMDAPRLLRAFETIQSNTYFGSELKFRPVSPRHEERAQALGESLPVASANEILQGSRFQPIVPGVAFGYLRLVRGELDVAAVQPTDVLVTEHVPDELPPAAALVTSRLQAPLAHVAILSRNRATPDMTLRDAVDDEEVQAFEGRLVRLEVTPQDYSIREATLEEAEAAWSRRRPAQVFAPILDDSVTRIHDVCALRMQDVRFAGAKAAQLGEVCSLDNVQTPGGFVVPFAAYFQHINPQRVGIASMLSDQTFLSDRARRAQRLEELRRIIERTPVDRQLVREIRRRIGNSPKRWIFRSSTNAEDLVGFNGAGLYRSIVVDPRPSEAQIETTLREVWSSVWLQRAFEERDWYRIDHERVAMAILIQPFVDHVVGQGVAITRNPYDEGRPGVYINVQTEEGSVTGAGDDELPEQVIIYTWNENLEFEVVSRSTRTGGQSILNPNDLRNLATLLQRLHDNLEPTYGDGANAVDVEFLLTRDNRRFVIVQARPITIRYTEGQGWRTP